MSRSDKLTLLIICILGVKLGFGEAIKVPFRVNDVLPVLPKEISWPVLNNLHSAVDLLPSFVGAVTPNDDDSLKWKGACFYENSAKIEFVDGGDRGLGGGVLHLNTSSAHSWTCMDLYVLATPYRVAWDYYFASSEHKLMIESWEEAAELEYIMQATLDSYEEDLRDEESVVQRHLWVNEVVRCEGQTGAGSGVSSACSATVRPPPERKNILSLTREEIENPRIWAQICLQRMSEFAKERTPARHLLEPMFVYFDKSRQWLSQQGLAVIVLCDMCYFMEVPDPNCGFIPDSKWDVSTQIVML